MKASLPFGCTLFQQAVGAQLARDGLDVSRVNAALAGLSSLVPSLEAVEEAHPELSGQAVALVHWAITEAFAPAVRQRPPRLTLGQRRRAVRSACEAGHPQRAAHELIVACDTAAAAHRVLSEQE